MPEEVVAIVIIAIIAGTLSGLVKQILEYKKSKHAARSTGSEGASLTTSELRRLMQAAVEEGNLSLEARFDELEARLDRLEKRGEPRLLPAADEALPEALAPEQEVEPVARGRRSRP